MLDFDADLRSDFDGDLRSNLNADFGAGFDAACDLDGGRRSGEVGGGRGRSGQVRGLLRNSRIVDHIRE